MNLFLLILWILAIRFIILFLNRKFTGKPIRTAIYLGVGLLFLLLFLTNFSYSLSPGLSARLNAFVDFDDDVIESCKLGENWVYVFYDEDENLYRTAYVEKQFIGYKSTVSTYSYKTSHEQITTVGEIHVYDKRGVLNDFYLISVSDNAIRSIGIYDGDRNLLLENNVTPNENLTLIYSQSDQFKRNNQKLIYALDDQNRPLYYYGYPQFGNVIDMKDYKWHEIEG